MPINKGELSHVQPGDILQDYSFNFKRVIEVDHSGGVFMACDMPGRTTYTYNFDGKQLPANDSQELYRGRSHRDISHYRPDFEGVPVGLNHYALYCRDSNRFCINGQWFAAREMQELAAFVAENIGSVREI